jgi:hypothetical protein
VDVVCIVEHSFTVFQETDHYKCAGTEDVILEDNSNHNSPNLKNDLEEESV